MTGRLKDYCHLIRINKPIGILLLLWPTLWALWIASHGKPHASILLIFIAGAIIMRSAGCIINDVADRNFDAHVARTRTRPIAAGTIKPRSAIILFVSLCLLAFLLVLLLNKLTVYLAIIGVALTLLYPYLKRFTSLPQLGLGVAFAWGVPMAFAAVANTVPPAAWLLFAAAAIWAVIYDTMYAMVDREDDLRIGIKSTAILFGNLDTFYIAVIQAAFLFLLAWSGFEFSLNLYYYLSLLAAEGFFAYQQYLIKDGDTARCYKAFLNNNWVGLMVFLGIVLSFIE